MKQISLEIESFYSDLLETKSDGLLSTNFFFAFVENLDIPKLSFEESMSLESDLTLGEIKNVLKSFQNNKTPGGDRFSKEFFKHSLTLLAYISLIHIMKLLPKDNCQYLRGVALSV